ncbi:MAG: DUF86 domain-containing protein [Chloroflexi bacterium]|nr:DUF86 domain-containing protein [Chloroflexota bacterium]MDL1883161.1 DUF86 domain-containing protein [Anaerolineae bacterium CFX8]
MKCLGQQFRFMRSDRDRVLVQHILDAISAVFAFVSGRTLPEFLEDDLVASAVIKKFEIIGEASNRLSASFRSAHPNIPWQDVIGMRNILIHDYMGVDLESVWDTIHRDLKSLQSQLQATIRPD